MKVLIFGTTYIATEAQRDLAEKWWLVHGALNPRCDLLFVDSASPLLPPGPVHILQLGDNIGHLSRGGQDGWGRAFCAGLQYAIDEGYDYVVHVEGDSLTRLPIYDMCEHMRHAGILAAGMPVVGTTRVEHNWVETGFMLFSTKYVDDSNLIGDYDWRDGAAKKYPRTPEHKLFELTQQVLFFMSYSGMRDDRKMLTASNVQQYDWISHTAPEIYEIYAARYASRVPA